MTGKAGHELRCHVAEVDTDPEVGGQMVNLLGRQFGDSHLVLKRVRPFSSPEINAGVKQREVNIMSSFLPCYNLLWFYYII